MKNVLGRYRLNVFTRSGFVDYNINLNQNVISYKTLLIVRVPAGKIGLVTDNGTPLLL